MIRSTFLFLIDQHTVLQWHWRWLFASILGLGMSLVRQFTGSLIVVILFHCLWNLLVFGARAMS